ncbi:MAG: ASKHA domain-containing protein [Desulfobacteraceae bacterium]
MEKINKRLVRCVDLARPELGNNTADAERLKKALEKDLETQGISIPLSIVAILPEKLRKWDHRVKCVVFKGETAWTVAAVKNPESAEKLCGIAADIGTTRVVLQLIDLETGRVINETAFDNPQSAVGPDILARIHYAAQDGKSGLQRLKSLIIEKINDKIDMICKDASLAPGDVYLFSGAGNTAMTHLFLGIDPCCIIREPYIPAVNSMEPVMADTIGLALNPDAIAFLFPNTGSYFGGDLISGIYYSGLYKREQTCLMVDVGTNAEVVVGNSDWLIACAGAAGPALEGGISDMGMTAGPGVIDKVAVDPETGELDIHTIDDRPAVGICGSGMIDLAAALFLSGRIDIRGKFSREQCRDKLFSLDGIDSFQIVDRSVSGTGKDIVLTQVDMNSLTSSKAAMHAILEVIVNQTAGLGFDELEKFYVAGTFGSFINPESAISIGMLPDIPREKFEVLGNSSLKGAAKLLLHADAFEEVEKIKAKITYIELNVNQSFMNIFSGAKFYPHTDRSKFPSVRRFDER